MIAVGLSHHFHNKENRAPVRNWINKNGESKSNTGYAFVDFAPHTITAKQKFDHATSGKAYSVSVYGALGSLAHYRDESAFIRSQSVDLDFDNDVSIDDILAHPFAGQYLSFAYPSASSGNPDKVTGKPIAKSRVSFELDEVITDVERYRLLVRAAMWACRDLDYDTACKDAARFFYGSDKPGAVFAGHVLPVAVLEALIPQMEAEQGQVEAQRTNEDNARIRRDNAAALEGDRVRQITYRYAVATLDNLAGQLAAMGEKTGRNNAAFKFGAKMGNMIAAGMISRSEVESVLINAALRSGLPTHESAAVTNGINRGERTPFDVKKLNIQQGKERAKKRTVADLNTLPTDDTETPFTPVYTPPVIEADSRVNLQYVNLKRASYPKQGVTVIVSDKGTGKSTYGADVVKEFRERGKSIMAITPYQSLTAAAANNYGLSSYKDVTKWNERVQSTELAITLKSIGNFALMDMIPQVDLLLLDEFSKMLEQLWSALYKKDEAYRVFNVLTILIQNAEHVLIMDADTKQEEIDFLKSVRSDVHVIVNEYSRDCGLLKVHETRDSLQDALIEALNHPDRNKRPIVYVSNTASEIETMECYLRDNSNHRVLSVYSGNSSNKAQRAFLACPDDLITGYDAILLSPSAMTGIDIQTPVFAKFGCLEYSPRDTPAAEGCCQLFERARNAGVAHVWTQFAEGQQETNPDVIYEHHRQAAIRTDAYLMGLDSHGRLDLLPDDKRLHMLQSRLKARDNASRNNLFDNVLNLLSRNYKIVPANDVTSVHKDAIMQAAIERKEQFDGLVLTVDPVSYETLEEKAKEGNVTLADRAGHERFQIETFYNLNITPELYEFDSNGKGRGKVRFYADVMFTPEKELQDFDWQESDNKVPVMTRQHRTHKARLAKAFIVAVWGSWQTFQQNEPLLQSAIIERASQFLEKHFDDLKVYFDYRDDYKLDTWNTVKRFFRRLGLPFKEVRSRDENTPKRYLLDESQRIIVHDLAVSYRQGIEARRDSEKQSSQTESVTKKRNSNKVNPVFLSQIETATSEKCFEVNNLPILEGI